MVTGRAETTDTIFCDAPQGSETASGCPVPRRQEPPPRGTGASCGFWQVRRARSSEARVRRTVFSLDKDLHGCRQPLPYAVMEGLSVTRSESSKLREALPHDLTPTP